MIKKVEDQQNKEDTKMNTNCPLCYQPLNSSLSSALCSNCGWSQNTQAQNAQPKRGRNVQMSIAKSMIVASIGFLLVLFHFSKWGSDSFSIVYLKTAEVLRLAGANQYKHIFEICKRGNKHDCMENTLKRYYSATGEREQLKNLALFQMRREKTKEALASYKKYFSSAGDQPLDAQSTFNYAKLLEKDNQLETALTYYEKILSQKGQKILPVNVVRNKLNILIQLNRKQEALQLVNRYKTLKHEDKYLEQEIATWEKQISSKS